MNDECEHRWIFIQDYEGDPSIPNGVNEFSYWECLYCGMQVNKKPDDVEDE